MASDDKTEDPTPKRRDKFREDGRVAQSRDIGAVVVGITALGLAYAWGPGWARDGKQAFADAIRHIAEVPDDGTSTLPRALGEMGGALVHIGAPVCFVAWVGTTQTGRSP